MRRVAAASSSAVGTVSHMPLKVSEILKIIESDGWYLAEAIEFHLEGLRRDGLPIPHPTTVAATIITTDAA